MRRRNSASSASVTFLRNGQIALSSAATAARASEEDPADMIVLHVGNATCVDQPMPRSQFAAAPGILRKAAQNARYAL
jgi:hypothetical protein